MAYKIEGIERTLTPEGYPTDSTVELIDNVIVKDPTNPRLWCLRGDCIQMSDHHHCRATLQDARDCYLKAIELAPDDPEAYESLGYFYDVVEPQLTSAEDYFRKALDRGGGLQSYLGLARVFAQQNLTDKALALLSSDNCPYQDEEDVQTLRKEIQAGKWRP